MIHPLVPYAISGVVWYQGAANVRRAWQYRIAFPLLIKDWRTQWAQGELPFYFCQRANFGAKRETPADSTWAVLRESQSAALKLPNTGHAILIDLGEARDIHPRNKKDVGERLAHLALAKTYGREIPFSGPIYKSAKVEGDKIRVTFRNVSGGLKAESLPATYVKSSFKNLTAPLVRNSPQSKIEGFAISGKNEQWHWANARIDGDSVLVWSDEVPHPLFVRYAWANNPTANLSDATGLPATPFRTDAFPVATQDISY